MLATDFVPLRKCHFVLTTASIKIGDLLSGPFLLNIPVYQRPYSWGIDQAQQLLDDLMEAAGLGSDPEIDDSYFLGTILLMDGPGVQTTKMTPKMSPREFDVVDGQQRLVTLLTLFCVLRDLEDGARKVISKRVQGMVLAQHGSRFFRTERFRLHLSSRDRIVFEDYVLPAGKTLLDPDTVGVAAADEALLIVRDVLVSELSRLPDAARQQLFDFVADRCNAVVIISHDIDRAHRLFVVLNERGKKLQRDDILKADILSRVPSAKINWVAQKWDETSTLLGKDFEVFFSHVRKIYGYDNRQVVSGVRSVVSDVGGAEPFINTVFLPLSRTYQTIRSSGEVGLPDSIKRRLFYLNRLSDGDWAPAAMLALKDWDRDPERAEILISEIDRMANLMRLLCAGTGKRVRRFADIVDAIKSGQPLNESHAAFQLSREESRSIAFHLKDMHKRGPKICKLLLMRLGDVLAGTQSDADPDLYTIEHILPQRPSASSEWRRLFPTAEERAQCVESLGNLVLISQTQNDKARNASFAVKKVIYADAPESAPLHAITRDAVAYEQWRSEEIEERETKLLVMISNMWRIDLPPAKSASRDVA